MTRLYLCPKCHRPPGDSRDWKTCDHPCHGFVLDCKRPYTCEDVQKYHLQKIEQSLAALKELQAEQDRIEKRLDTIHGRIKQAQQFCAEREVHGTDH